MRDEFMITRQGKQFVLFQGLLDEAHGRGLRGIDTELIQVPNESNGNVAVIKATVHMEGPGEAGTRTFSGIGDASPDNVGRTIAPHLIRMAETRAKARALRDAVNVEAMALEELSDAGDAPVHTPASSSAAAPAGRVSHIGSSTPRSRTTQPRRGANNTTERPAPVSKAQKSQIDLLKTLAVEWRGESGVERLEGRIGKPLADLSRDEADEWIDRLTPEEHREQRG